MDATWPKPDWKRWRNAKTLRLWQCIALSLDLDPDSIDVEEGILGPDPEEFRRRLRQAEEAVRTGALPTADGRRAS